MQIIPFYILYLYISAYFFIFYKLERHPLNLAKQRKENEE